MDAASLYGWKFCLKGHTGRHDYLLCYLQELGSICTLISNHILKTESWELERLTYSCVLLFFNCEHVSKCLNFVLIWHLHLAFRSASIFYIKYLLTLPSSCISESCIKIKIKLNFYYHTSLWCLKRFYEGLLGLHKTFWGTSKKCENKNLSYFFLSFRD